MKIDNSSSALLSGLTSARASVAPDAFAPTAGSSSPPAASIPAVSNQVRPAASNRSAVVQAEINSQLAALRSPSSNSQHNAAATGDDVHDMTNAQLLAYGQSHGLGDIAAHFQVDYASADRSAAGLATFQQSLMSDPTRHDFVEEFTRAARWQAQHGASDGGASFSKMAAELLEVSAQDKSNASKV